jgi:hypothetical protein
VPSDDVPLSQDQQQRRVRADAALPTDRLQAREQSLGVVCILVENLQQVIAQTIGLFPGDHAPPSNDAQLGLLRTM